MRSRPALWGLAASCLVLAACGTRLPDSAFVKAQQQAAGAPVAIGPSGQPLPGVSAAPGGRVVGGGGSIPGGVTTAGPSGGPAQGGKTGSGASAANTASDTGVTATTITIGSIASKTNPFDPRAFVGPLYGIEAFVRWTNAHGGIHGRQLVLKTCDDQGSGDSNVSCVHQLIDSDHVFALVSNAILAYSGAGYVNSKGVPDIGSQPIDNAYAKYPHLWDIYGEEYPRDGKQVGFNGKLYGGTEVYRYFKNKFPKVPLRAGVVEYNQDASQRFGDSIVNGLQHEGYTVDKKVVNFALPDYDSVAIDFKNKGVQYVYDTIDRQGNVRLCKAFDDNGLKITAKVLTTQSWEQSIRSDYGDSPTCRNEMWVTGNTLNFEDTSHPQVAAFRQQMAADGHGGSDQLSEWALEGWAGGQWFADAASSCGAKLTRRCVEGFMNNGKPYDAGGLLTSRFFAELKSPREPSTNCINVARWLDSRNSWVTQVADMQKNCFTVHEWPYQA
ncbi:MAG TPA: ABC transporter substrate-binding protein [Mycobacteriales bacterium]|jgi:ABC-type branched-subunit amino acid transport system substrate-binding protein|nr:ABC transporter substrate-binding protein [Mycobacteriales bacterium]